MTTEAPNSYIPYTPNQIAQRREAVRRRRRKQNAGQWTGVTLMSALVAWGAVHAYNKHNHVPGAATKAQIRAMVGDVPKGIKSIRRTEDPDVRKVHYVVQPGETLESQIAANLHPMAADQTQDKEDAAIDTYLPPEARSNAEHNAYIGFPQEFDFLIDTTKGEILPKPENSK